MARSGSGILLVALSLIACVHGGRHLLSTSSETASRQLWVDPNAVPTSTNGCNVVINFICGGKYNTVGAVYLRKSLAQLGFSNDPTKFAFGGNAAMSGWRFLASFTLNFPNAQTCQPALAAVSTLSAGQLSDMTATFGQRVDVQQILFTSYQVGPALGQTSSPPPPPPPASSPPPPPFDSPPPPPVDDSPPPPTVDSPPPQDPSPPSPSETTSPIDSPPPTETPSPVDSPSPASPMPTELVPVAVYVQSSPSARVNAASVNSVLCPALRSALIAELNLAEVPFTDLNDANGCSDVTTPAGSTDIYYKTTVQVAKEDAWVLNNMLVRQRVGEAAFLMEAQVACNSRVVILDVNSGIKRVTDSAFNTPYLVPGGGCSV